MSSGLYVALSGQVALERRLATIAANVANMNTPGFRAEGVKFETVLARQGGTAYAATGQTYLSRQAGPVTQTGNPLDVAIDGDAFLALSTPDGTVYTRDGRLSIGPNGDLLSTAGYAVLDPGGAPLTVDPAAGPITIAEDGMITQGGAAIGALGLFLIPDTADLRRYDNSAVIPSEPAVLVEDPVGNGVRQGFIEGANVNPILEMTRLIEVSRAFENAAAAVGQGEGALDQAIRALGPS